MEEIMLENSLYQLNSTQTININSNFTFPPLFNTLPSTSTAYPYHQKCLQDLGAWNMKNLKGLLNYEVPKIHKIKIYSPSTFHL